VFIARYALSPYIKQIRFVFKGLSNQQNNLSSAGYTPVTHSVTAKWATQKIFTTSGAWPGWGEWLAPLGQQSSKGGKMGRKNNIYMKIFDFLLSEIFKLLR
jgi:hypothetical protein